MLEGSNQKLPIILVCQVISLCCNLQAYFVTNLFIDNEKEELPKQLRGGLVYTKIQYCLVRRYSAYMSTEATMPMICCDTVPEIYVTV